MLYYKYLTNIIIIMIFFGCPPSIPSLTVHSYNQANQAYCSPVDTHKSFDFSYNI
jgi:Iap family predicted aminopeptidase